jgi:hypothetical protein
MNSKQDDKSYINKLKKTLLLNGKEFYLGNINALVKYYGLTEEKAIMYLYDRDFDTIKR